MNTEPAPVSPPPPLAKLLATSAHPQSVCVLAILTWVASADGTITPQEEALLRGVAAAQEETEELTEVMRVARLAREDDLELACKFLRTHMDRGEKRLMTELAITMAIEDGRLSVGENLLLQFIADLLGIAPRRFARWFNHLAQRPFPPAGDPSSIEWWRLREAGAEAQPVPEDYWGDEPEDPRVGGASDPAEGMTRARALRLFGLAEGATPDAVHRAYRRLAKARHPDRFAPLGPAAVATAGEVFQRLKAAYDLLVSPASESRVAPARASA